jgi:hypothetical protein
VRSAPEVTQLSSIFGIPIKMSRCICCPSTCQTGTEDRTGVALPIFNRSSRREWGGQSHAPDSLRPGKRPGTLVQEGGWKISLVTVPTETSRPPTASYRRPVLVAARSKAWVCGLSLGATGGFESRREWMSVCCECCVLSDKRSLRRADHSSRGVLLSVVCLSVILKPR